MPTHLTAVTRHSPLHLDRAGRRGAYVHRFAANLVDVERRSVRHVALGHGEIASALSADGRTLVVSGLDFVSVVALAPVAASRDAEVVSRVAAPAEIAWVAIDAGGDVLLLGADEPGGGLWRLSNSTLERIADPGDVLAERARPRRIGGDAALGTLVALGEDEDGAWVSVGDAARGRPTLIRPSELGFVPHELVAPWPGAGYALVGADRLAVFDWPGDGVMSAIPREQHTLVGSRSLNVSPRARCLCFAETAAADGPPAHRVGVLALDESSASDAGTTWIEVGPITYGTILAVDDAGTVTLLAIDEDEQAGAVRVGRFHREGTSQGDGHAFGTIAG